MNVPRVGARMALALVVLAAVSLLIVARIGRKVPHVIPRDVIKIRDFRELSGIAWRETTGTLLAVSDHGFVAELTTDGEIVRRVALPGRDLEDIALFPGERMALVLDERSGSLLEIEVDTFEVRREVKLPRIRTGNRTNRGYEGLAVLGPDRIVLVHEDEPVALVVVAWPSGDLISRAEIDAPSLSGVAAIPGSDERVILLSRRPGLRLARLDGTLEGHWLRVAADQAEGLAFAPGRGLFVALDYRVSRLLFFEGLEGVRDLEGR